MHIKGPIKPVLNQTGEGRENFPRKAIEDKEIIEKLNQFLLDNKIQYSCLFGVDNNPIKEKDIPYFTQCEPNDGEFPEIISLITEQMVKNYRNHGENCVSLVECAHKVRMVNDSLAFQLSPTNSRYFVYGIFALTNNLEPSLLSINLSTDRAR